MLSTAACLVAYNDSDSSSNSDSDTSQSCAESSTKKVSNSDVGLHLKSGINKNMNFQLQTLSSAAPAVEEPLSSIVKASSLIIDPLTTKEIAYNPKYADLYAAEVGPQHKFQTDRQRAVRNTINGYVEPAHVNDFHFDLERKTFDNYGFAHDPSVNAGDHASEKLVYDDTMSNIKQTNATPAVSGNDQFPNSNSNRKTVFESQPIRPKDRRKKVRNTDAADLDNYLGPWAKYEDQIEISRPGDEDKEFLDEYNRKRAERSRKRMRRTEEIVEEETTVMHLKDTTDYQGRTFMQAPQDIDGVNLRPDADPPEKCFIPKRQIYEWPGGHGRQGVSVIKWFPGTAHLLLSGGMDNKVKLWEVYRQRRCIRSYLGHRKAVIDTDFTNCGDKFLSTAYDRQIKLWDTETGQCVSRYSTGKTGFCVRFNPDEDKQHLFVAGMSDKKIVCWDVRTGEITQEYDRHLGAVNSITFVDENRRIVTTSDDKSLRLWDWDIPVDIKYVADPSMHSMPRVTKAPNNKWLACQSLDNRILVYSAGDKVHIRKKEFKGHMVAGYACSIDFSPEMSYIASGDGDGKCSIWNWKTTRMLTRWKAHDRACVGVLWHPHETSKVVTCGWDGKIKYWD